MYLPAPFREDDPLRLHALIRAHGFATLISEVAGEPFASHLPLLLDAERGPKGTLVGHMARANPQWRHFGVRRSALAIFHGPHCYVSPSWYVSGPAVPTWNYVAIHAYGRPRLLEHEAETRALLGRMVETYESGFETPWPLDSVPDDMMASLIREIVAFEVPIERLEGKLKLSQNRPPEDRAGVRARLAASTGAGERAVARLMDGEF